MIYNLEVQLYTDGDYFLNEEITNEAVKVDYETYYFNWTIQAKDITTIKNWVENKIKAIQSSVVIPELHSQSNRNITKEKLNSLFSEFYAKLDYYTNYYTKLDCYDSDLIGTINSCCYGNWEGTEIIFSKTALITL